MAAANDSQGLKIAVAAFVTLTVVLAVATYFTYSSYSEASAKLTKAQADQSAAQSSAAQALRDLDTLKERAGYGRLTDFAAVSDALTKDTQSHAEKLTALNNALKQAIDQYSKAGGDAAKVAELQQQADQIVAAFTTMPEANRNQKETIERLLTLLDDLGQLTTQVALDNENLRKSLKSVDQTNAQQLEVQTQAATKAEADLRAQVERNERERMDLVTKYSDLQRTTAEQATEIAGLKQKSQQDTEGWNKNREQLLTQLRFYKETIEAKEDVMDIADARVQFVDYSRGEVRTDLGRRDGVRERMRFTVFDRNTPVPAEKSKGLVELIQVGDRSSLARIIRTNTPSDPIRDGDQLYSPTYDRNRPQRFALIGKLDMDRNGTDDRADLRRMIEASGGVIDYDLPPSGAGQESGELTGLTTWYVIDDQEPIRGVNASAASDDEDTEFLSRRTAAVEKARQSHVRAIQLNRLLAYLGYRMGDRAPGQAEGVNRDAMRDLLRPAAPPADGAAPATPPPGGNNP